MRFNSELRRMVVENAWALSTSKLVSGVIVVCVDGKKRYLTMEERPASPCLSLIGLDRGERSES
jgi:hypothetical protein